MGDAVTGVDFGLLLAMEGDEDQAEGVDRGQEGADQAGIQQPLMTAGEGLPEDLVLGVEAGGDQRQRSQGGTTDDEAGIGGAILIVVGLVTAAISSPILDRNKKFLFAIKTLVPVIALCYLVFIWMPETRSIPGPYVVLAVLGAACFALVPIALEYLIELSHPISPEITSTTAWAGGQLLGAIFVIISDALVAGEDASPPKHMKNALIFQAVIALVIALLPLSMGCFGRAGKVGLRRIASDSR